MIKGLRLSASLMCSRFAALREELEVLKAARVDEFHVDVMDGHFVPNYALGPDFIREIAKLTDLPIEAHLMVREPERCIGVFERIGVHRVAVHVESTTNLYRLVTHCKGAFPEVYVALNPLTPVASLELVAELVDGVEVMTVEPGFAGQPFAVTSEEKIRRVRNLLNAVNPAAAIEVDGAINVRTIWRVRQAGADLAVIGGSGLYSNPAGFAAAVDLLEQALEENLGERKEQA
ncbi:MAG TPA: ribulose-phosphate 3-epimerase [Firmicutes bacterium]|nr:ribulose-phosphate 3-epimerase [Bacillota bacterium]